MFRIFAIHISVVVLISGVVVVSVVASGVVDVGSLVAVVSLNI